MDAALPVHAPACEAMLATAQSFRFQSRLNRTPFQIIFYIIVTVIWVVEKVGNQAHPLRHLPSRKRSPGQAAAGFFRCIRGLCTVGFALATSPQQPDTFTEALYSPDLSTAPIQCRAHNLLKVWGQFCEPSEHFDVRGVRGKELKSNLFEFPSGLASPYGH